MAYSYRLHIARSAVLSSASYCRADCAPLRGPDRPWRMAGDRRQAGTALTAQALQPQSPAVTEPTCTSALWQQIVEQYSAAQAGKAASTFNTRTDFVRDEQVGVTFVLKVAAQLRDKPKAPQQPAAGNNQQQQQHPKQFKNPFLPPDPDLFVCHLSETHSLVLNKFNVMPYHLLVITRQFEPQLDPLNVHDLAATWTAMQALPTGGLAFYNCGPLSGASQPHKHVQVVPLPLHGDAQPPPGSSSPPFAPVIAAAIADAQAGEVVELRALPCVSFAARLPADPSSQQLEGITSTLLERCRQVSSSRGQPAEAFSYNAILTEQFMMLVPRSAEAAGPVSCNSVAFAGSFFVRSEEELAYVRQDPLGILCAVGFPW